MPAGGNRSPKSTAVLESNPGAQWTLVDIKSGFNGHVKTFVVFLRNLKGIGRTWTTKV